jgi:hypothetical protein
MRRLNVRFSQLDECIQMCLFAIDSLPKQHRLERGEVLLLQLVLEDARRMGRLDRRIEFALIFERAVPDPTGSRSRQHWPNAGKTWRWILEYSDGVATIPFSLERLGLSRSYAGQSNPEYILPQDEARIRPYLKGETQPAQLTKLADVHSLLAAIRNYDTVVRQAPVRSTKVSAHERLLRDPWLGDALKAYYEHRCQICLHDFTPRYGVPYADTRFLEALDRGGEPVSRNTVVVCPNHNAIIGEAGASFEQASLSFLFPNGLREKLTLRDHLL